MERITDPWPAAADSPSLALCVRAAGDPGDSCRSCRGQGQPGGREGGAGAGAWLLARGVEECEPGEGSRAYIHPGRVQVPTCYPHNHTPSETCYHVITLHVIHVIPT